MWRTSEKELIKEIIFVITQVALGIFVPSVITGVIAARKASSFCQNNLELCNQYSIPNTTSNVTFPEMAKKNSYQGSGGAGMLGTFMAFPVLMIIIWSSRMCWPENYQQNNDENEKTYLINRRNSSSGLFKQIKQYMRQNPGKICLLIGTTITFILAGVFTSYLNADTARSNFCHIGNDSKINCSYFFSNLTAKQNSLVEETSHSAYSTAFAAGATLETVANLCLLISSIMIRAWWKYYNVKKNQNKEENQQADLSSDDDDQLSQLTVN